MVFLTITSMGLQRSLGPGGRLSRSLGVARVSGCLVSWVRV